MERGDANGYDQKNAKQVVLIDDLGITLTLYHYNSIDRSTAKEWWDDGNDEWHGDLELVIKRSQMANVEFGFCIDTEANR